MNSLYMLEFNYDLIINKWILTNITEPNTDISTLNEIAAEMRKITFKLPKETITYSNETNALNPIEDRWLEPLTLIANVDNSTIGLRTYPEGSTTCRKSGTIFYKLSTQSDEIWQPYKSKITLKKKGDYVQFFVKFPKPDFNKPNSISKSAYNLNFYMTGEIIAKGNVCSMINFHHLNEISNKVCAFRRLFQNCKSLIEFQELREPIMMHECYRYMFYGCKNLKEPPVLSGMTTLAKNCCLRNVSRLHITCKSTGFIKCNHNGSDI